MYSVRDVCVYPVCLCVCMCGVRVTCEYAPSSPPSQDGDSGAATFSPQRSGAPGSLVG